MKMYKDINLIAYEVVLIDRRAPKGAPALKETIVLDGGRINALGRLCISVGTYIADHCSRHGYGVAQMRKLGTVKAPVDLNELWVANYIAELQPAEPNDLTETEVLANG